MPTLHNVGVTTQAIGRAIPATALRAEGATLHWLTIAASAALLGGLYWDGWAHGYNLPDSFWTVWHAAFYAGYAALAVVIGGAVAVNRPSAASWRAAVPAGYGWAIVGAALFAFGGAFDIAWHTVFGIEASTEALISPSHLVLATGIALMVSAPLRAAWARGTDRSFRGALPAVLSLTALFSLFTFMNLFAGPYADLIASPLRPGTSSMERQLIGIYLFTGLLLGHLLVALRLGTLPIGAVTILVGTNGAAMVLMRGHAPLEVQASVIAVAIVAGLAGDALLWRLRPSIDRAGALRAFAFALPAAYFAIYLGMVVVAFGTTWRVHSLVGVPLLAGVAGLLLSYLVVAPSRPAAGPR